MELGPVEPARPSPAPIVVNEWYASLSRFASLDITVFDAWNDERNDARGSARNDVDALDAVRVDVYVAQMDVEDDVEDVGRSPVSPSCVMFLLVCVLLVCTCTSNIVPTISAVPTVQTVPTVTVQTVPGSIVAKTDCA